MTKDEAVKEIYTKRLEEIFELQRNSLYEFLLYYWETEKKQPLDWNWHIKLICDKLEDVFYGKCKRLMINIPPRSLKTEIVSRIFPARCLGKRHWIKFMGISYSSWLSQDNSGDCRAIYQSDTYKSIFPRTPELKEDQNTKQHWENTEGWQYYASWSTGTITGKGCDIMVIDDPLKPDDAMSDIVRVGVNNNFHNTLYSRLNDKVNGAIVIIMQRLHDDDLCWHLIEQEPNGEKRKKIVIKAIAEEDEEYRKQWESFFEKRFPIELLQQMKRKSQETDWWIVFSSQYQQEATNKETQEFHEERFKYHWTDSLPTPSWLRIFTTVDPAFKQGQENDQTSIITWWFLQDKLYILEITAGKYTADVMQDKIIYHIKKRSPEKVGIEAFQAQSMIVTFLKQELQRQWLYSSLEEITQSGDKLSKIRKLVTLYRNWLIFHKYGMDDLELQLKRFPRGKHDDIIDSLQMLYNMYELQPNTGIKHNNFRIEYDQYWIPYIN